VPKWINGSPATVVPDVRRIFGVLSVLPCYVEERGLCIERAAELAGTSKRTLQRRFAESGTRYSDLLDQARFHAAKRLLRDPDMTVTAIAFRLGYSDSANFARAFRRIAGSSPSAYRRSYDPSATLGAAMRP